MGERLEALMRIVVLIITGIVLELWKTLIQFLVIIHWIYVIIAGNRILGLSEFANIYSTQRYRFVRYLSFATNERPFPFSGLGKDPLPVDIKKKP